MLNCAVDPAQFEELVLTAMYDVVICGAGPGGAALANILASRGVKTALVEKQSDFSNEFRGEGIMPSGFYALKSIGFNLDEMDIPQQKNLRLKAEFRAKKLVSIELPFGDEGGLRWVSQPALLEYMVSKTEQFECFGFYSGCRIFDVLYDKNRAIGVKGESKDGAFEIKGRVIIGFDGRSSTLRKKLKLRLKDFKQIIDIVWFKIPYPTDYLGSGTAYVNFVKDGFMVCPACYGGMLQVGWIITKGTFGKVRELGFDNWFEEILKACPDPLSDHFRSCKDQISERFVLNVGLSRCESWSKDGVILLGDAAHTMNPVGGQGINLALRDAIVAANYLVPALRNYASNEELDNIYSAIERERLPEIRTIQNIQRRPTTAFKKQNPILMWIIKNSRLLARLPLFRVALKRIANTLAYGVTEVRLKV